MFIQTIPRRSEKVARRQSSMEKGEYEARRSIDIAYEKKQYSPERPFKSPTQAAEAQATPDEKQNRYEPELPEKALDWPVSVWE